MRQLWRSLSKYQRGRCLDGNCGETTLITRQVFFFVNSASFHPDTVTLEALPEPVTEATYPFCRRPVPGILGIFAPVGSIRRDGQWISCPDAKLHAWTLKLWWHHQFLRSLLSQCLWSTQGPFGKGCDGRHGPRENHHHSCWRKIRRCVAGNASTTWAIGKGRPSSNRAQNALIR